MAHLEPSHALIANSVTEWVHAANERRFKIVRGVPMEYENILILALKSVMEVKVRF